MDPTPTITVDKQKSLSPNGQYLIEQTCRNRTYANQSTCTDTLFDLKNKKGDVIYTDNYQDWQQKGYHNYILGDSNVWSLDSKYFELMFMTGGVDELIFKSDGTVFSDGERYVSVGNLTSAYLKTNVKTNIVWLPNDKMCISPFTNIYLQSYILDLHSLTFQESNTPCSK